MNKKVLNILIYAGAFSSAYAGFFYQKYESSADIAATDSKIANTSAPAQPEPATIETATSTTFSYDHYQVTARTADEETELITDGSKENAGHQVNIHESLAITAADYDDHDNNYDQTPATPLPEVSNTYSATALTSRTYDAGNAVSKSTVSTTGITSSYSDSSGSYSSGTGSHTDSIAVSDGTEFLPDGSSQQDLFDSQSKKPRVYTVKDYQQADISCAQNYGTTNAHAELIFALKGC